MTSGVMRAATAVAVAIAAASGTAIVVAGQAGAVNGEWRYYGGDAGNTRYAPLAQIDGTNFSQLEIAWRFKTDSLGARPIWRGLSRNDQGDHAASPLRNAAA